MIYENKYQIGDQVKSTLNENKAGHIKCIIKKSSNDSFKYSYLVFDENNNKYFIESENFMKLIKRISSEDDSSSAKKLRSFAESHKCESDLKVGDIIKFHNGLPIGEYAISSIIETAYGEELWHYELIPISNGNLSADESCVCGRFMLEFQYHDTNWEKYFTESVGNGLPAWRGKPYNFYMFYGNPRTHGKLDEELMEEYNNYTIPPKFMKHILESHSLWDRMDAVFESIDKKHKLMEIFGINKDELEDMKDDIREKINAKNLNDLSLKNKGKVFNKEKDYEFSEYELKFIDEIFKLDDVKDHYPVKMTNLQIMKAIKEAYETAYKIDHTKGQISKDKRNGERNAPVKGQRQYRGESDTFNLLIEFWFDLDLKVVTTAYPVEGGM